MNFKLNTATPEEYPAFPSFFDDAKPREKIWHLPNKNEEYIDLQLPYLKAYLLKKSKKSNSYQKYFITFTSDYVCWTKVFL